MKLAVALAAEHGGRAQDYLREAWETIRQDSEGDAPRANGGSFFDYPADPYPHLRKSIAARPHGYAEAVLQILSLVTAVQTFPLDVIHLTRPAAAPLRRARRIQQRMAEFTDALALWSGSPMRGMSAAEVGEPVLRLRSAVARRAAAFFTALAEAAQDEARRTRFRPNISGDDLPQGHPLRYQIPGALAYASVVLDFPEDEWLTDDDAAMRAYADAERVVDAIRTRQPGDLWHPVEWQALYQTALRSAATFFATMAHAAGAS